MIRRIVNWFKCTFLVDAEKAVEQMNEVSNKPGPRIQRSCLSELLVVGCYDNSKKRLELHSNLVRYDGCKGQWVDGTSLHPIPLQQWASFTHWIKASDQSNLLCK